MRCARAGLTIIELLVVIVLVVLLSATFFPIVHRAGAGSMTAVSMSNLKTLSSAHAAYAADWNGRQFTPVRDDFAAVGGLSGYPVLPGIQGSHPPILLGWGSPSLGIDGLWGYWFGGSYGPGNSVLLWAIHPSTRFGWFRLPNVKALHDYVNGKFYEATFYAPGDAAVWETVEPFLDVPSEFLSGHITGAAQPFWSSYCMSPAALFHPSVMARENPALATSTGFEFLPPKAFAVPSFSQVRYPDLKTQMIEHNWVDNPPAMCNPAFASGTYHGCEPYYFNSGAAASPVTLFYDGHVRSFPNTEAIAADATVSEELQSVDGLWFSPGGALGAASQLAISGYFIRPGFDEIDIDHTILTVDGILGRDTLRGAR